MPINITKQPDGIYPAYNDSYIEFNEIFLGSTDSVRAEITVYPTEIFTNKFILYPDADVKFIFNLKECLKVLFNENGFSDRNFDVGVYWKSITGVFLVLDIDIDVYSEGFVSSDSFQYQFIKAAKQVGEPIHANTHQLLTYTPNGINHSLTYFEGFPFHFDILQVLSGSDIVVKSLNTGNETQAMIPTETDAFRINIDRGGGHNWTSDNILPLTIGLNRLELYQDGIFKSNISLTKKKKCSGVYLKWWNRSGGYNHFLFEEYFMQKTKSESVGGLLDSQFNNINQAVGFEQKLGNESYDSLLVKAKYNQGEFEMMRDLLRSPHVQLYTSRTAYVEGRFIDVNVSGNLNHSNKRNMNDVQFIIDMPKTVTAKL